MKPFLPALLLTLTVVLSAPFVGVVRNWLFDTFPNLALHLLAIALLAWLVSVLGFAIRRIRRRRALRYAGLVVVVILLAVQYVGFGDDSIEVKLVEKIHIVEYGLLAWLLYLPLLRRPEDDRPNDLSLFVLPLLGVTLAGTLDEGVQWLVMTRLGTVNDVGLDVFAGLVGLLFSLCLRPPRRFAWRLGRPRWVGRCAAVTVIALGLLVADAHLGRLIEAPEIGRFRSWHTLEELQRVAQVRAERWSVAPPRHEPSPWQREDLFLTEAGWHLGHRDRNLRLEHPYWAYQANRILETYYAPYLDLEPRPGRPPRRLDPVLIEELAQAPLPPDLTDGYLSPVFHDRIIPVASKRPFLATTVLLALLLAGLPELVKSTRPRA